MSFMLRNKPKGNKPPPVIRTEKVAIKTQNPGPKSNRPIAPSRTSSTPRLPAYDVRKGTRTPESGSEVSSRRKVKRKAEVLERQVWGKESDDEEDDNNSSAFEDVVPNKKIKATKDTRVDDNRNLLPVTKFTSVDDVKLVHARSIAGLGVSKKFQPAFGAEPDDVFAEMQYPGGSRREKYELVYAKSEFDPVEEILDVVKDFADFFLSPDQAEPFLSQTDGVIRRMEKAKNLRSIQGFKKALDTHNALLASLTKDGTLRSKVQTTHVLSYNIIRRILKQTYDRAVSPQIDMLKKYDNGTDFVYGELKSIFVYNILAESSMTSDKVFVDLGSGVANVVVQAALQIGCESWGCEIMENACLLANAQKVEFEARCRLWGLAPGAIHLEQGDFMTNEPIRNALKRADVVLVNNEVFTPQLNNDLVNFFLDLKDGCQIISLKSFIPSNHRITSYNLHNPVNLLEVVQKSYARGSVSWKDEGGSYFVATKDSKRLRGYAHLG